MPFSYLVLALLWIAYCTIHSALISISATGFFKRVLDTRYCYYRLFFNAFSVITLMLLLQYSRAPRYQGSLLLIWSGHWRILQYILILAAGILIFSGFRHYSISQFLGIHQIRSRQSASALTESGDLDSTGVLAYIRHPWYVAVFILLWTSNQNIGSIIVNSILSAYLVIGTLLEERKLVIEYNDKYRQYQEKVSMFIPLKWLSLRHR